MNLVSLTDSPSEWKAESFRLETTEFHPDELFAESIALDRDWKLYPPGYKWNITARVRNCSCEILYDLRLGIFSPTCALFIRFPEQVDNLMPDRIATLSATISSLDIPIARISEDFLLFTFVTWRVKLDTSNNPNVASFLWNSRFQMLALLSLTCEQLLGSRFEEIPSPVSILSSKVDFLLFSCSSSVYTIDFALDRLKHCLALKSLSKMDGKEDWEYFRNTPNSPVPVDVEISSMKDCAICSISSSDWSSLEVIMHSVVRAMPKEIVFQLYPFEDRPLNRIGFLLNLLKKQLESCIQWATDCFDGHQVTTKLLLQHRKTYLERQCSLDCLYSELLFTVFPTCEASRAFSIS